jgi:hypothetical protein
VREALLKFRADMGYFPGDGPLAATQLDLGGFFYVDGESPATESPSNAVRQAWASNRLNFWMLYEKPRDLGDASIPVGQPKRWDFNKDSARGWAGPYLGAGFRFQLDGAGTLANNFVAGARTNRLYAVEDAITLNREGSTYLNWVSEDRPPTMTGQPDKKSQDVLGRPIAFIKDDLSTPNYVVYWLVSAGRDGVYDGTNNLRMPPFGDDVRVEVARLPK